MIGYKTTNLIIQQPSLLTQFPFKQLEKFRKMALHDILYAVPQDIFFEEYPLGGCTKDNVSILVVHHGRDGASNRGTYGYSYGMFENKLTTVELHRTGRLYNDYYISFWNI